MKNVYACWCFVIVPLIAASVTGTPIIRKAAFTNGTSLTIAIQFTEHDGSGKEFDVGAQDSKTFIIPAGSGVTGIDIVSINGVVYPVAMGDSCKPVHAGQTWTMTPSGTYGTSSYVLNLARGDATVWSSASLPERTCSFNNKSKNVPVKIRFKAGGVTAKTSEVTVQPGQTAPLSLGTLGYTEGIELLGFVFGGGTYVLPADCGETLARTFTGQNWDFEQEGSIDDPACKLALKHSGKDEVVWSTDSLPPLTCTFDNSRTRSRVRMKFTAKGVGGSFSSDEFTVEGGQKQAWKSPLGTCPLTITLLAITQSDGTVVALPAGGVTHSVSATVCHQPLWLLTTMPKSETTIKYSLIKDANILWSSDAVPIASQTPASAQ